MIKFGGTPNLRTVGLVSSAALLIIANAPVRAQTAEEQARSYSRAVMEQALQTKERFDLYGLHFDSDSATIQPDSKSLLDDIAASLKNFPDWRLRIVGHTDSTGDPQHNLRLSLDRATAIQAALVDRGSTFKGWRRQASERICQLPATPRPKGALSTAGLNSTGSPTRPKRRKY